MTYSEGRRRSEDKGEYKKKGQFREKKNLSPEKSFLPSQMLGGDNGRIKEREKKSKSCRGGGKAP